MKNFLFFWVFILLLFLFSCYSQPSSGSGEDDSFYRDDGNTSSVITNVIPSPCVKNLIFLISLKINDGTQDGYVVSDKVESIAVKLNDKKVGSFDSVEYDISKIEKRTKNNFYVRSDKFQYQVIIKTVNTDLTGDATAGDYVKIMNGALSLGDYIFEIENLKFSSSGDSPVTKTVYPHYLKYFSVKESAENFFVGDIEISVDL